jgi:hypothetical protein
MASIRPLLFAAALPLTLVACGGDDGGGDNPINPTGDHYKYVVNKVHIPTTNTQATEFGLDLDGNNSIDNQLGKTLVSLKTVANFDIQGTVDEAVLEGSIILLMDFQTEDFTNHSAAGLQVLLGENPSPAACNDGEEATCEGGTCTGCGHHLENGSFSVSSSSPSDAVVAGKIVNGTFTGGPGQISLQIALGEGDAIQLDLVGARAKATGISENGITSVILAGALTQQELDTKVLPAIHAQLAPSIEADCTGGEPDCGCESGSTGAQILAFLDKSPVDCQVTLDEIKNNSALQGFLAPDTDLFDANGNPGKDGVLDSLGIGIKVEAKKATF